MINSVEDNLVCRHLHVPMLPLRPSVHCPHIGPTGGDMCLPRYARVNLYPSFPIFICLSSYLFPAWLYHRPYDTWYVVDNVDIVHCLETTMTWSSLLISHTVGSLLESLHPKMQKTSRIYKLPVMTHSIRYSVSCFSRHNSPRNDYTDTDVCG